MNKPLADMIEAVAYEKNMPIEAVRQSLATAVASLARREHKAPDGIFEATIDERGEVGVWRVWQVVDNVMDEDLEMLRDHLPEEATLSEDGTVWKEPLEVPSWNRQGLAVVKQVLYGRLRVALRDTVAAQWSDRVGDLVTGRVKRFDRGRVVLDLGEPAEGVLGHKDLIPGERFRVGQSVRALVASVTSEGSGPAVVLTRTSDAFLRELLALEIPEIDLGYIDVRAVSRIPGVRAKIAVEGRPGLRGQAPHVCAGMRGARAQTLSDHLHGERMDFLPWCDDPYEMMVVAMQPVEVITLVADEQERRATLGVAPHDVARAIGSRGQHVRLVAGLTGWEVSVMDNDALMAQQQQEREQAALMLSASMDLDAELAQALVEAGFDTPEDILVTSVAELLSVAGLDVDTAQELIARASEGVRVAALLSAQDSPLFALADIHEEDVVALAAAGVDTLQELADCAVDDLAWPQERQPLLGQWILEARERVGMI